MNNEKKPSVLWYGLALLILIGGITYFIYNTFYEGKITFSNSSSKEYNLKKNEYVINYIGSLQNSTLAGLGFTIVNKSNNEYIDLEISHNTNTRSLYKEIFKFKIDEPGNYKFEVKFIDEKLIKKDSYSFQIKKLEDSKLFVIKLIITILITTLLPLGIFLRTHIKRMF